MKTYGIVGYPLGHSCSPAYFNHKFQMAGIEAEYLSFEIEDINALPAILQRYPDLQGFNVTIPHKQNIIPFLNDISEEGYAIGAVNCVRVSVRDGKPYLIGYNTDMFGFRKALLDFLSSVTIRRALILGNGGAAKAVRYALYSLGIEEFTVTRHRQRLNEITYDQVSEFLPDCQLVVNTTPLGTWPEIEDYPDIPYHLLTPDHYLFDLVYNPEVTEFMKRGQQAGAHVCNGYAMWLGQAEKNAEIWGLDLP